MPHGSGGVGCGGGGSKDIFQNYNITMVMFVVVMVVAKRCIYNLLLFKTTLQYFLQHSSTLI